MKKIITLTVISCIICYATGFAQVAVNNDKSLPDSSAMLDIKSTTKGILIPRMTSPQRTAIVSPAKGLLVYDSSSRSFWFHNGVAWTEITAGANGWNLTGNSNLSPGINFIGTTDKEPLVFKVNNTVAGNLDTLSNVSFGVGALAVNTGGHNLVAIGDSALYNQITNPTGSYGNTAVGSKALFSNATAYGNTAVGYLSLYNNGTGANVALDEGSRNTAVGDHAMYFNTKGLYNTAIGSSALADNTTGYFNTALGYGTLGSNVNGINNSAVGLVSLAYNTSGSDNTALGARALQNNIAGYSNVALGGFTLYNNTAGHNLVAIGDSALYNQVVNSNGYYYNTAVGSKALYTNSTGYQNTANGYAALYSNTTGNSNTANGSSALSNNSTGSSNTAAGDVALSDNSTGSNNTANGFYALAQNTTGNYNTAIGSNTLLANAGSYNTAIGSNALNINSGSYTTAIGYNTKTAPNNLTNATAIGANAIVAQSNSMVLGSINGQNGATAPTNVGIGVTAPQARLHIHSANTDNFQNAKTMILEDDINTPTLRFQGIGSYSNKFCNITLEAYVDNTTGVPSSDLVISGNNSYPWIRFEDGNTQTNGDINSGGYVYAPGFFTSSDARLKKGIQPLQNILPNILKLNGYTYYWKESKDTAQQIGVLAQELQKVYPQLVATDKKGMLSVKYMGLVPVLLTAIKEQQKEIDDLTRRLEKIETVLKSKSFPGS